MKNAAPDITYVVVFLLLLAIGTVTLFSVSYSYSVVKSRGTEVFMYMKTTLEVIAFMLAVTAVGSRLNYSKYINGITVTILSIIVFIMLIVVIFYHTSDSTGTSRWIDLGFTTLQPSEFAKVGMIILLAFIVDRNGDKISDASPLTGKRNLFEQILDTIPKSRARVCSVPTLKLFSVVGGTLFLVFFESHLSALIIIGLVGIVIFSLSGVRGRWIAIILFLAVLGVTLLFMFPEKFRDMGAIKDYHVTRINAFKFKDPNDVDNRNQTIQALNAIGSGGFFGKGFLQSTQKMSTIAEAYNDMIFSVFIEECGLFGGIIVIALFAVLTWRGFVIGLGAPDRKGMIIACGISTHFAVQVILNILVVTDTIINTGVTLPLFSYGGTALMVNMAEVMVVIGISRKSKCNKRLIEKK